MSILVIDKEFRVFKQNKNTSIFFIIDFPKREDKCEVGDDDDYDDAQREAILKSATTAGFKIPHPDIDNEITQFHHHLNHHHTPGLAEFIQAYQVHDDAIEDEDLEAVPQVIQNINQNLLGEGMFFNIVGGEYGG